MRDILADLASLGWADWLRSLFGAGISAAAATLTANPIATALGANQFTGRQLGIMALSSAVVAVAGILRKSPLPDRRIDIALLSGVHTREQVEQVVNTIAPGVTPTPAVAAAVLGLPAPPPTNVVPITAPGTGSATEQAGVQP